MEYNNENTIQRFESNQNNTNSTSTILLNDENNSDSTSMLSLSDSSIYTIIDDDDIFQPILYTFIDTYKREILEYTRHDFENYSVINGSFRFSINFTILIIDREIKIWVYDDGYELDINNDPFLMCVIFHQPIMINLLSTFDIFELLNLKYYFD